MRFQKNKKQQAIFSVPVIAIGNLTRISGLVDLQNITHRVKRFFRKSIYLPFILIILFFSFLAGYLMKDIIFNNQAFSSNKQTVIKPPLATESINRSFSFPIMDQEGGKVGSVRYEIQKAELREEIVIRGQRATVVNGKKFLVFNLKLTNTYDKAIQINARDFVRVSVNKSSEKLAPDIHNDPVEVQAVSTKFTRVGFPIEETAKNLTLQIGEINGKKQMIRLDIQ